MKNTISDLFYSVTRRPEIRSLVPMGYTPGLPVLTVRNDELCVEIPFLRYKVTGEKDRTLVFPVRYVATYLIPELQMVEFVDLAYAPGGDGVDYGKAIGFFRHKAIADLSYQEYDDLRRDILTGMNDMAAHMLGQGDFDVVRENALGAEIARIIEPSLYPFYKSRYPKFFEKFITDGKDI